MKNLFKFAFAALTVAMLSTACGGAKTEEDAAEATPATEEVTPAAEEAPAAEAAPVDSAAAPAAEAAPAEAAH
jgi:hypothetical protein